MTSDPRKILRTIWRELRDSPFTFFYILLPVLRNRRSGGELKRLTPALGKLRASDLIVVAPFYGEDRLLLAFLDYHRKLGVDIFVLLDLSESGGLAAQLQDTPDCAVWRPRSNQIRLKRALLWLNYLRWRYATGRWCLSLEPSDFVVFHHSETRKLKDFIEFVDSEHRDHVFGVAIEMYSDRPAAELTAEPGKHPLEHLPYFDPLGYETAHHGPLRNVCVRGGPHRRLLFPSIPRRAPALNRIPLVKWQWFYSYGAGTRAMMPRKLNIPHSAHHSNPTVCLLSFAQLSDDAVLARAAQAESNVIVSGTGDPTYPATLKLKRMSPKIGISTVFKGSADLVNAGLLNPGQWF